MGGYNGSGVYQRYFNWSNDANAGIDIRSDRMDTEDSGFATGLSNCITKDGQQTITANIGFNGFKVLNIGDATLAKDAVNVETLQTGALVYGGTTTGTNTYVAGLSPALSAYAAGQMFSILIGTTCTGASTLNINGLGNKSILKLTTAGLAATAPGDLVAAQEYDVFYDGTQFQVMGSTPDPSIATTYAPLASPIFTGTPSLPTGTTGVTQTGGDSSTKLATTAFVGGAINSVVKTVKKQIFTGSGTYTPSTGMLYCSVKMTGGGGGGAGGGNNEGGGGSAAGHCEALLTSATVGASQTITIGAAGAGGISGSNNGTAGTASSFGAILVANGGGKGNATSGVASDAGGTATGGDLNITGQRGGQALTTVASGAGAGSQLGAGGPSLSGANAGIAATGYGAGGSGGISGGSVTGGNGAPGVVYIIEYCSQ